MFDFQQYETIRSFGESIYTGKINMDEAEFNKIQETCIHLFLINFLVNY